MYMYMMYDPNPKETKAPKCNMEMKVQNLEEDTVKPNTFCGTNAGGEKTWIQNPSSKTPESFAVF